MEEATSPVVRRDSTLAESTHSTPQVGNVELEANSAENSADDTNSLGANDDTDTINGDPISKEANGSEENKEEAPSKSLDLNDDAEVNNEPVNGDVAKEKQEESAYPEDNISPVDSKDEEPETNGSYEKPYLPRATRKVTL